MHLRSALCATTAILILAAPAASGTPIEDSVPDDPTDTGPTAAQAGDVMVIDNEFDPEELTVTEGTTVVWEHTGDNPHTVTADDESFDSHENCPPVCMQNGDTYEQTFEEAGQVPYFCKIHGGEGGQGMSGTITVEAETTQTGTPDDTDDQTAAAPADTAEEETAAAPADTTAGGDPLPVTGGGMSGPAGSAMLVGAAALLYVMRRRGARGGDGGT